MTVRVPFYLSYAWKQEREDAFVAELEALCAGEEWRDLEPRRDTSRMHIGDDIRAFVKEIGASGCVVAVVSDAYLKSHWCMAELLEAMSHDSLAGRLLPVNLTGIDFDDPPTWDGYLHYWRDAVQAADFETGAFGPILLGGRAEMRDARAKILSRLDDALTFLRSRLSLAEVKGLPALLERLGECRGSTVPQPEYRFPQASSSVADEPAFADLLAKSIAEELAATACRPLREALAERFADEPGGADPALRLATFPDVLEAVRRFHMAVEAAMRPLRKAARRDLWEGAERIFGWLILRGVDPAELACHRDRLFGAGGRRELRLRLHTHAAAEIVVSRIEERPAAFELRGGRRGIGGSRQLGAGLSNAARAQELIERGAHQDYVREWLKELWEAVILSEEPPDDIEHHVGRLNTSLALRQIYHKNAPYLSIRASDGRNPMNRGEVAERLQQLLPALRMVFLDLGDGDDNRLLIFNERDDLLPHLEEFLKLEPKP